MAITNYAIIDQVGSLDKADIRKAYFTVNAKAEKDGYVKDKTCFTMKSFCKRIYNPHAKKPCEGETLQKLKFSVRHNKNPRQVYFICYEMNLTAQRELDKWTDREIPVMVYESATHSFYKAETFEETHQFIEDESRKRRCAEVWADALGYSFSAPVTRTQQINNIDCYASRNKDERRELIARDVEVTKVTSDPQKFLEQNRCVATVKEINAFWDFYVALYKNDMLKDALDPDYVICKHCGRPTKIHYGENACRFCETPLGDASDIIFDTYYDDSFEDSDEFDCE